jgi:lactate permease
MGNRIEPVMMLCEFGKLMETFMELTVLNWILALSPVLTVLIMMVGLGQSGNRAGIAACVVAIAVGMLRFGAGFTLIGVAMGKSVFLALDVLFIVWMALFFYNVTSEAGTIQLIGKSLPRLTSDRALQSLLISWIFVSLLQGVGGFGVPVAVVAPLLVGLGYTAMQSVIMASLGHGWAVTFGSLGTSFAALMAVTGLPENVLAHDAAVMLGLAGVVSGALVAYVATGWRGMVRSIPALLIIGTVMGVTQWLITTNGMWALGSTSAALAGGVVGVLLAFSPLYHREPQVVVEVDENTPSRSLPLAIAAYAILLILAFSINLVPALETLFGLVNLKIQFPAVTTAFGVSTPPQDGKAISLFGHPGAILFYAGMLSYLLYQRAGYYKEGAIKTIWQSVSKSAVKSTISILALVAMAAIMGHTGMTQIIARGISETFSAKVYPLVVPFIGMLGAFMTGSNTNSNVVFGALQQETAALLGLSVPIILAGQTAGASVGSVIAPAKVIVGCSTVGLSGEEGPVIRQMLLLGIIPVILIALMTWAWVR